MIGYIITSVTLCVIFIVAAELTYRHKLQKMRHCHFNDYYIKRYLKRKSLYERYISYFLIFWFITTLLFIETRQ